jgi:choline dehydrogenase-like flavoprotein
MITGRVLGGTSTMNNGLYTRCQPGEFNDWGEGWSYEDLAPLYDRSENNLGRSCEREKVGEWTTRIIDPFFPSSKVYFLEIVIEVT